jgi:hypothetical protein
MILSGTVLAHGQLIASQSTCHYCSTAYVTGEFQAGWMHTRCFSALRESVKEENSEAPIPGASDALESVF